MSDFGDKWYVRLPSGEVGMMTLDELDQAFNEGRVSASTEIVQVGGSKWAPLGEVAGLEHAEPSWTPPPVTSARPSDPMPYSLRPVAADVPDVDLDEYKLSPSPRRTLMVV